MLSLAFTLPLAATPTFGQDKSGEPSQAEVFAQLYNGAMQAFQQGNWAACATGLESLIKQVPAEAQAQLAPAYFTLGAAYFNAANFPKAIEAFKSFITKFPNAEKFLEARLALAQSYLADKNYDEALKLYAALEAMPALREQALTAQIQIYRAQNKIDDAIRLLEKLVGADIKTSAQANAAVTLVELYAGKGQTDKAVAMLDKLQAKTSIVDNLVGLNGVAIKLADEFAEKKLYKEAIAAYRMVRSREEVIKFQTDRIAAIEKRLESNTRAAAGNPQLFVQVTQQNNLLKSAVAESKQLLEEFTKLPDYASSLLFRMARCWYEWDKKWEALVVYRRLLEKYPTSPEREPTLYGIVVALADLNRTASTQAACDAYLKEFPNAENAGTVGYMSGAVALQAGDYKGAESFFGIMLDTHPKSTFREEMRYLLGNTKFAQGRYDESTAEYERYLKDYPQGANAEECTFRIAVTNVFVGEYEKAMALLAAYVAKYPQGLYLSDAKYRLAVCQYAASEFETVIKDCQAWQKEFPGDPMEGEVTALLGDAYAATNQGQEAAQAYSTSFKKATTDEVLNYSLFEASKQLQKLGQWEEMAQMFTTFVTERPDHPSVIAALYWVGKAKARNGQLDEAKQLMVENLKKYIAQPKREAVEQLLSQLAQLCSKRPKPPVVAEPAPVAPAQSESVVAGSSAAPAPPPEPVVEPPPYDPYAELARQLKPLEEGANGPAKARLLYAQAEMASLKKQEPAREKILREIAERFQPADLSPVLLAVVGDFLLSKGELERAGALFEKLREDFPKSDHLDVAYVGLGEIAFAKKDYAKALELFSDALDKVSAAQKTKEATVGKAKTLLELGKYAESKKLFEQVAAIREWRGDSTAFAVYSLGEIEARQGKLPEAIAFYRRVFVAYQKYLPWVAKSYLKAAETFDSGIL